MSCSDALRQEFLDLVKLLSACSHCLRSCSLEHVSIQLTSVDIISPTIGLVPCSTHKAKKKLQINGKTLSGSRHLKVLSSLRAWQCTDNFHLDFFNFINNLYSASSSKFRPTLSFVYMTGTHFCSWNSFAQLCTESSRCNTFRLRKKLWIYKQGLLMMFWWCFDTAYSVEFFAYCIYCRSLPQAMRKCHWSWP